MVKKTGYFQNEGLLNSVGCVKFLFVLHNPLGSL